METERTYRLIALDMDGTLLNSRHEITDHTLEVLKRAVEAGKTVAIATGRCLSELTKIRASLPDVRYAICANGANLYDLWENRLLREVTIAPETIHTVFERLKPFDVMLQTFSEGQSILDYEKGVSMEPFGMQDFYGEFLDGSVFMPGFRARYDQAPVPIAKLIVYFHDDELRWQFCRSIADEEILATRSLASAIELTHPDADKGKGLRALCGLLGVDPADTIAIGDGGNDVDLLRGAGLKIAMANALDGVKAVADVLTDDNDHEGVANAIVKYML